MISFRRYTWILHLFVIGVACFFLAQTVSTYIAMLMPDSVGQGEASRRARPEQVEFPEREAFDLIAERNIFSSEDIAPSELPPEEMQDLASLGEAVETTLGIKVSSILVVGEGMDRRSSVSISGGSARSGEVYFIDGEQQFAPDTKITKIMKDRIEFINKGRLEFAKLEDAPSESIFRSAEEVHGTGTTPGPKTAEKSAPSRFTGPETETPATENAVRQEGGNHFIVDQAEIDNALSNMDKLYTEIRIVPNFKGGRPAGMKVLQVAPGSIFNKLGIQRGDILERINGTELDIQRGMQLFSQLQNQKSFTIDVLRRGKNETLEYEIR